MRTAQPAPRHLKQQPGRLAGVRPVVISRGGTAVATGVAVTVPAGLGAVAMAAPASAATPQLGGMPAAGAVPTAAPQAAPATPSSPVVVIRYGSRGPAVNVVQSRVGASVDGHFGPQTRAAVQAFQRSRGLSPDGVVGPATWHALGGYWDGSKVTPPEHCDTLNVIRYGWSGGVVQALQTRLDVAPVDARFGPQTLEAVKAYQRSRGLAVDGVVGPATWKALGGYPCSMGAIPPAGSDVNIPGEDDEPDSTAPIGSPNAAYRMPYPAGVTHRISQGPGGQTSHHTVYNRSAIDIAMPSGSTVTAARSGTVYRVGWTSYGAGKQIMIKDASGRCQVYAHLSEFTVRDGEHVSRGERIALSGNTGDSTGPHLHFDVISCSSLRALGPVYTYERGSSYPGGTYVTSRN